MHNLSQINEATNYIAEKITTRPNMGLILGSGLGAIADILHNPVIIPYDSIPHFAKSAAPGHANELIIGTIGGITIMVMKGRLHYYEGIPLNTVTFPVRVMKTLGVDTLILTNAAGAVNRAFKPGELMLIQDHINLTGANPMIGPNCDELGQRFLDVTHLYDKNLAKIVTSTAQQLNIPLHQGVYVWLTGPSYETPAEIRMLRTLGADAVGMSTVPEALIAHHAGIKVVGISCLTNMAAGIVSQPLNHEEVIENADKAKAYFLALLQNSIINFAKDC